MAGNRAWFSYVNRVSAATITTDSEALSLPVTNVANRLSHKIWRTEATTAKLQLDFGSALTWQSICVQFISHRDPVSVALDEISESDQITIKASNTAFGDTDQLSATVNANVIRERGYFGYLSQAEITSRYLEITIAAASRASYFNVGFAHVGPIFQPASNYNIGSTLDFEEDSLVNTSPTGGATFAESRQRLLSFQGLWGSISTIERESWQAMQEKSGTTLPVVFGLTNETNLARKIFIARFDDSVRLSIGQNGLAAARVSLLENR